MSSAYPLGTIWHPDYCGCEGCLEITARTLAATAERLNGKPAPGAEADPEPEIET